MATVRKMYSSSHYSLYFFSTLYTLYLCLLSLTACILASMFLFKEKVESSFARKVFRMANDLNDLYLKFSLPS